MPNLNPFVRATMPYHRVSKEFSENEEERSPTDTRLSTLPDEIDHLIAKQAHSRPRRKHAFCYALVCIVSLLTGIVSQFLFRIDVEIDGYPAPFGHSTHILKDVVWQRNETFQASPSAESEQAWMALMPKGRGSIRYPKDSPLEQGMTVFHGIHCLYNLHTAYHAKSYLLAKQSHITAQQSHSRRSLFTGPPSHSPPASPIFPTRRSPPPFTPNPYLDAKLASPSFTTFLESDHLAHCFDYLRQSLMCAADSNLETGVRSGEGGAGEDVHVDVTGWGVRRVCRDFEGVRAWAEEWRGEEGVGVN